MDNIVSVKLDSRYASTLGVWQYDYGRVLRITGPELPPAVEVQFSLAEKSGETLSRVGTTVDGVTEVKIPDELLTHSATSNYRIYAYIYLTDETSGNTEYEITIPVRVRSKPTSPAEDPETDPDLFRETVVAVNASAERAENAASSAMESAASADETLAEIKRVADGISGNIENANTMKSELSDMINNAGIEKKELESSIGKAGEAKMALDSSIRSAGEKQLALDVTVEHANAVDASLKEHIGSAEKIQANVEQIAKNKADISSLKEDLGDIESKFEIETEAFSNKCSIIRNNTPNNFTGNQITGVKQYFDFGENAALTKIKMNIKASNDDTVVLEIATLDGNIIATAEKAVTTEYTDVVFDLENIVIKEPVSVFVYTKGTNLLSYGLYATPYDDQSFSYIFPDGTRKSAFKIGTSEIPKPTASSNKQCLVLFFDYTSKIIKNISDSISQNIDITLLKSGKAADAKVVGDKLSKLEEDLSNKITKFYASNQGENHLDDSDDGKIQDMMICGNSNQNQTKGKNLLKYPYIAADDRSQGIIFTDNKDGSISVSGTATGAAYYNFYKNIDGERLTLASGTYKLVVKGRSKCNVVANNGVNSVKNEGTFTITDGHNEIYCYIAVREGVTVNETIYPMIQLASITDESYEPYTGGIPSPSPDYPQEIKRVVNPVVKVCGKNLLQPNLRYNDRVKINIKKGVKLTLICKNGVVSKGGNLKFETANGGILWFGFDKGSVKQQITLRDDVVAFYYLFNLEPSESYALYIGDENTYEPYKEQFVQLPYTLNAIPVASGGNVTIDGQQYIADYVDVERGKLVRMCKYKKLLSENIMFGRSDKNVYVKVDEIWDVEGNYTSRKFNILCSIGIARLLTVADSGWDGKGKIIINNVQFTHIDEAKNYFDNNDVYACYPIPTPEEIPITLEEVSTFKQLLTYYPVTNISVNSKQLDGYTVFNYPISMANGWNYVKQQLGDTRDYIYDMDAKAQDIDIQSAEAYVNSEYAVALAELEVM